MNRRIILLIFGLLSLALPSFAAQINGPIATGCFVKNTCSTAPYIVSISSDTVNGSYTVGSVIDIDVTFSEAVTSTGNVTVTLETGTTDRTCTFVVSNSDTGSCNYTVEAGDNTTDLEASISGTISDNYSHQIVSFTPVTSLAVNKALVIDAVLPVVNTFSPADDAIDVAPTANLVMVFNRAVIAGNGNLVLKNGVDHSIIATIPARDSSVTGSGSSTITINPAVDLAASTSYYLQIDSTAFTDVAGNNYGGITSSTTWNFTTAAATEPTTDTTSSPVIATIDKTAGNLLVNYDNGTTTTLTPFAGRSNFRFVLDASKQAIIATNGQFVRVFVNGTLISQMQIHPTRLSRAHVRLLMDSLDTSDDYIFVLLSHGRHAKLISMQLTSSYSLTNKAMHRFVVLDSLPVKLRRVADTTKILAKVGSDSAVLRTIWELQTDGQLKRLQ